MKVNSVSIRELQAVFGFEVSEVLSTITESSSSDGSVAHSNPHHPWLVVSYATILVVGVLGNLWVISVIGCGLHHSCRRGTVGPPSSSSDAPRPISILILALCCCDLIVLPFLVFLITDLLYGHWMFPLNPGLCRLYLCSESLNKFCGPLLLVALSGYCYVSVCANQSSSSACWNLLVRSSRVFGHGRPNVVGSNTKWCLTVIGAIAGLVILSMTPIYIYGDVRFIIVHNTTFIHSITPKCAFEPPEPVLRAFVVCSFVFGFLIPAFLFTFFYAAILTRAWQQSKKRDENTPLRLLVQEQRRKNILTDEPAGGTGSGNGQNPQRQLPGQRKSYLNRVIKTTMGMVLFYGFSWTPYWIMSIYQFFTPWRTISDENPNTASVVLSYLVHMLPYINCTGYPILYTLLNNSIKDAYRKSIRMKKSRRRWRNMETCDGKGLVVELQQELNSVASDDLAVARLKLSRPRNFHQCATRKMTC